jgi:ppGpp synthetase/RelA/SpoT-type nucleotidyltranferase
MITQEELKQQYENDKPIFEAWGNYVTDEIKSRLIAKLGSEQEVDYFLKIPPKPRVKETKSFLGKAFLKRYENPYEQITDKVGTRFVVLLTEDIKIIEALIEDDPKLWRFSKDRDHIKEREENPMIFTYQSDHYILYSVEQMFYNDRTIPLGTSCEVQIRTLLQHAYSELSHDTDYKPRTTTVPNVKRNLAKSMALIETVDDFFGTVSAMIKVQLERTDIIINGLNSLYGQMVGHTEEIDEKTNSFVVDTFLPSLENINIDQVREFLINKPFIIQSINEKAPTNFLFRQPAVLLLYYLVETNRHLLKAEWPLPEMELWPILSDLGVSHGAF